MEHTSSFSSVSRLRAAESASCAAESPSLTTLEIDPRSEGDRREIPLREDWTFGETADLAVAPLAIFPDAGVEPGGRRAGGAVRAVVAICVVSKLLFAAQ